MASRRKHTLIFVDDESIVRDGISSCIAWEETGFKLAGMFENGEQALNFIEHHPVDIVITDINMPKMDGLTLSRILSEQYPHVMVLLLTGYDEFEYAQAAVKNHVREFLLKPITADELTVVLKKVNDELNLIREKNKQQELMREKLKESFPLLKERFLYKLVSGRLTKENIRRRKDYYGWKDLGKFYRVIVISLPSSWDELDAVTLAEFLKAETAEPDEVFSNSDEDIILLLQDTSKERLKEHTRNITEKAFSYSSRLERDKIFGGCGGIVEAPGLLHRSYSEACTAVDYSRVLGLTRILSIENIRERKKISPEFFISMMKNLTDRLKEGGRNQTKAAVEKIFQYLEEHFITSEEASHYLTRLHFHVYYFLDEMDLFVPDEEFIPRQPELFNTLNQGRDYFILMIDSIEDRIQLRRNDIVLSRIDKAKEIITNRFRDSNFSLKDICNELYLSTSQFSLLFKEGTGQTFVEYLTSYRIEEAKKLLKTTDNKVYEIADDVGYTDPRYFSLIFKKTTGMTALEYRVNLEQ